MILLRIVTTKIAVFVFKIFVSKLRFQLLDINIQIDQDF